MVPLSPTSELLFASFPSGPRCLILSRSGLPPTHQGQKLRIAASWSHRYLCSLVSSTIEVSLLGSQAGGLGTAKASLKECSRSSVVSILFSSNSFQPLLGLTWQMFPATLARFRRGMTRAKDQVTKPSRLASLSSTFGLVVTFKVHYSLRKGVLKHILLDINHRSNRRSILSFAHRKRGLFFF